MHLPLLPDLLIILGFSIVIVFLLRRMKLPSILGFIIAGIIIGPHGLSLVKAVEQVELISEIGVILLLFVIGMELSLKQLMNIRKTVFIGGSIQVGLTILVAGGTYYLLGNSWGESVFIGFLFSLSSTAIVLKVFQDRNEINTPHGKNALAILIFQDIIVVPMMLLTPILAGESGNLTMSLLSLLLKSGIVIIVTIVSARYLVPFVFYHVAKTRSKELFLMSTIGICFAVAFLTSEIGLSLALGAFLAGLIVSESEYSHQATGVILPFRELFTSFFFVSIGMLLDLHFFIQHIWIVLLLVAIVLVVKTMIAALAVAVLRYPPRTILITGLALFQVGEFAFILSKVGIEYNILNETLNQYFLSVSIISMFMTPFVIMFSEHFVRRFLGIKMVAKFNRKQNKRRNVVDIQEETMKNHLVIVGYGINGSNIAKAAEYVKIPYLVLELNMETVRREKQNDVPIIYGDAMQNHILETLNVHDARAVVIAISDPKATRAIIKNVREISKSVFLIVRTRYVKEIPDLLSLGADDVIPEEFETSIELFLRVMRNFLVPEDDIESFIDIFRTDNYDLFRTKNRVPRTVSPAQFPDFNITSIRIEKDSCKMIGKPIGELDIRANFGVNILGILRKGVMIEQIVPEEKLYFKDVLFVHGKHSDIEKFHRKIS